ncbi:ATP-binding protein [Paucibacter sp. M5-1]|uniref:ATP-binding protein n=1 Tax=Paucibacter sp. M5-1 TaxID=3015998 RepID=UPI003F7ED410
MTPPSDLHASSAARLVQRYHRLLWLVSLPLLLLVLLLGLGQGLAAHRNAVGELERGAARQRAALQALARAAEDHVQDLRRFAERELITPARAPDALLAEALRARDGGYTLDELPQLLQPGLAQLLWPGAERPDMAALWRLQAFAALAEAAHNRHADLARSYWLAWPQRHALLYPWLPSGNVLLGLGRPELGGALEAWYAQAEFGAATPDRNNAQRSFWLSRAAEGRLVHGAPVYAGEEFRGLVATELRLSDLSRAAKLMDGGWRWWLLGEDGRPILQDRPGALPHGPEVLEQALGLEGRALADQGQRLLALPLRSAPWTLVATQSEAALLTRIAPELLPFGLIACGLLALILLGQWLLRRRVIEPALAVMRYLFERSRDATAPEPQLNARWQPWVDVVSATFAAQQEARERERRSEAYKSAIVDHALAAIISTDESGRVVEWNPAAAAMFGHPRSAVLGRSVGELIIPERLRAAHEAGMARVRSSGSMLLAGKRLEMSGRRADGSEFPIEMVLARTDVAGSHHYTAFINDVSERQQAQQEIERQREALRQSEKLTAMGSLLAGVAHELNNPLSIVLGRAALLEGKAAGGALGDDARRIREAAERCGRIVRTFLNMARAKPETRAAVPLNELVRAAVELLGYSLRSGGITLELALAADLPELPADPDRLGQLVMNLIVNAQQALSSQDGERRIRIASGLDADRQRVWLRVADNGPGIAPGLRERIFTPFFTTKGAGELQGTGLGLAVARGVAREHGGELLLEDTAGGASFLLRLPLAGGTQPAAAAPAPIADAPQQLRILVVDDETELAALMREALEGAGYEVMTAESGLVALELLEEARFEAIVSDLRMPGMDGAALWRAVRERQPQLATRMLFVTGDTLSPGAAEFLREAGCAVLEKPFAPAEMVARVAALTSATAP